MFHARRYTFARSVAVRVCEIGSEAPEWVRAGSWLAKSAHGIANAAVWFATFLPQHDTQGAANAAAAAAETDPLIGALSERRRVTFAAGARFAV